MGPWKAEVLSAFEYSKSEENEGLPKDVRFVVSIFKVRVETRQFKLCWTGKGVQVSVFSKVDDRDQGNTFILGVH